MSRPAHTGITLEEWDARYRELRAAGLAEPSYGGPLGRHVEDGDLRLLHLRFDPSPAALRLWNFLLTEEDRLGAARAAGKKLVGCMKDLGTVPVMAYAFPNLTAFYPDGAWWIPCVMELNAGLLGAADRLGMDESFCPVRAMLGAFLSEAHFPLPDLITCSVGAVCDDFSVIAQRLQGLGYPVLWWEIPHRRRPEPDEHAVPLPGGLLQAPADQVAFVQGELERVRDALETLAGTRLGDPDLARGIGEANRIRRILGALRRLAYTADPCPLPALELLVAEMLAIHFCSDRTEAAAVLEELLEEVKKRVRAGTGALEAGAARIFWVNPVADLRVMNLLEECGGRVCGSEFPFSHALDEIPEEFQDCLTPSIRLDNRELIEKIGQCAHLFMSYPRTFWITNKILRWLPFHSLKLMLMDWLVRITRELIKKGTVGLPSVWHQPQFIVEATQSPQPDIPKQPVAREEKAEAA